MTRAVGASSIGRAWVLQRQKARWGRAYGATDPTIVFTSHFENNYWNCPESVSGPGSTLAATRALRESLPFMLARLETKRLFDAPCGDHHWFRHVRVPEDMEYLGGDIVGALVARNRSRCENPRTRFIQFDVTQDPFPEADLWLCRDCFSHLPEAMVFAALENFTRSRIPWLLATSHDNAVNEDGRVGGFRRLNLERPPYSFPSPTAFLEDGVPGATKKLGLWSRLDVLAAVERRGQPSSPP